MGKIAPLFRFRLLSFARSGGAVCKGKGRLSSFPQGSTSKDRRAQDSKAMHAVVMLFLGPHTMPATGIDRTGLQGAERYVQEMSRPHPADLIRLRPSCMGIVFPGGQVSSMRSFMR